MTEVRDGAAALSAARGRPQGFPVILMDLHMPGIDGLSAARAIREWEAAFGLPRAAILAVTADVLAETRAAATAAGIDAVLEKPMTPDALRRALAEFSNEVQHPLLGVLSWESPTSSFRWKSAVALPSYIERALAPANRCSSGSRAIDRLSRAEAQRR